MTMIVYDVIYGMSLLKALISYVNLQRSVKYTDVYK